MCAESVDVNYDEENYRVGRCPGGNCQSLQNENEEVDELINGTRETGSGEEVTVIPGNNIFVSDMPKNSKQPSISIFVC